MSVFESVANFVNMGKRPHARPVSRPVSAPAPKRRLLRHGSCLPDPPPLPPVLEGDPPSIEGKDVVSGEWLPKTAAEHVKFFKKLRKNWKSPGKTPIDVGTMCSGSEITTVVLKEFAAACKKAGLKIDFRTVFCCEINEEKARWCEKVCAAAGDDDTCVFKDCAEMGSEQYAYCWTHKGKCRVRRCQLLVMGFSCKDVSRSNANRKKHVGILLQAESPGGTANTFQALLRYLEQYFPDHVWLENVDALADDAADASAVSNRDVIESEMSSRGYETKWMFVDCAEFGIPCRRKRVYLILTRVANTVMRYHSLNGYFDTVPLYVAACKRSPPGLSSVMLGAKDPLVTAWLRFLKAKPEQQDDNTWREGHMAVYSSLKQKFPATPHPMDKANPEFMRNPMGCQRKL